ncbi:MAG TPA: type II toxin-antitoxin system HicB family antitoxin [Candidatus Binataceae bacterium]|nr:type II toxin-antitoxin system HicB family antitoxin [Candidatus Binataceae bacterium]
MRKTLKYYLGLQYRMTLDFDKESDAWVIRYPELPGCTSHGDTPARAIAEGEAAKALWLETAMDEGQTIPEPRGEATYSGKFLLRLPKVLHEEAVECAQREGTTLNTYLVHVISEGVARSGMKNFIEQLETRKAGSRRNFVNGSKSEEPQIGRKEKKSSRRASGLTAVHRAA